MSRSLKFVTFSMFAWGMGEGMFLLFQPIYLQKLGAEPILIGVVLGGVGLMTALVQIPSGYISDRYGTRPIMLASWVMGTLAAWGMALSPNLKFFIPAFLIYGLTGSIMAPMNAYITSVRGNWSAERSLTFTGAAYHLGTVIGPTLGGFLGQKYELRILYVIAASVFVLSTILIFFIQKPDTELHLAPGSVRGIFKNRLFMRMVILASMGLFFMIFTQSFTPVFLEEIRNINLQQIGFLGTIGGLGNVALALILGHLPARIGYLLSFPFVFLFPILIVKGTGMPWYGMAYFLFGGYRLARSLILAFSRQFIHSRETGIAYGVIETANGVATILAPLICGIIYNQNPEHIYLVAVIGLGITFALNLIWLPKNIYQKEGI